MTDNQMTERELITESLQGNRYAFAQLVEQNYMVVYKFAYKFLGNKSDAEDVTQNVLVKLIDKLDQFDFQSAFTTWLYKIVLNTARDYMRQKNRQSGREVEMFDDADYGAAGTDHIEPERQMAAKEMLKWVDHLPDKLRETVILIFWEGVTHAQAADILECKEGTISARIHDARKILNEKLEKEGGYKYG